jgi:ribosome-associated toxin RatA of RatAB toxin-antitoxin module
MVRTCHALILMLMLAARSVNADDRAPDPITRFVLTQEGDAVQVQAEAELPARTRAAWSVLTDYEGYPRFISSMNTSRLLSRDADSVIVAQRGRFSFLLFSRDIKIRKRVQESPPDTLDSEAIDGDFRVLTERYTLSQRGKLLHITYSGRLIPKFELPSLFGLSVLRHVLQRNFREVLDEIQRRESQLAPEPLAPPAPTD